MYAHRYFAARYFGPHYFPPAVVYKPAYFPHNYFAQRYFPDRYFPGAINVVPPTPTRHIGGGLIEVFPPLVIAELALVLSAPSVTATLQTLPILVADGQLAGLDLAARAVIIPAVIGVSLTTSLPSLRFQGRMAVQPNRTRQKAQQEEDDLLAHWFASLKR